MDSYAPNFMYCVHNRHTHGQPCCYSIFPSAILHHWLAKPPAPSLTVWLHLQDLQEVAYIYVRGQMGLSLCSSLYEWHHIESVFTPKNLTLPFDLIWWGHILTLIISLNDGSLQYLSRDPLKLCPTIFFHISLRQHICRVLIGVYLLQLHLSIFWNNCMKW